MVAADSRRNRRSTARGGDAEDTTPADHLSPTALRQVNDLMREGLRNRGPAEPIAFFCECDDPSCYQAVWLRLGEYDALRADPRVTFIVAEQGNGIGDAQGRRGRTGAPER